MPSATTTEKKRAPLIPAFGIRADHPRNCDLLIQSIPGCRLRGTVRADRTVKDNRTGEETVPRDQAIHLGSLPVIPGMEVHVNPAKLEYVIQDPLCEDEALCGRIQRALRADGRPYSGEIRGVEATAGKLDKDRMKTLVRELARLVANGHAKVVQGVAPDEEDVDDMVGRFLNNPGAHVPNSQPRYEDQMEAWVAQLGAVGG